MWRFKFSFGRYILPFTSDHSQGSILLLPTKKKSHRAFFWHIRIWFWSILKSNIKVTQISNVTISQTVKARTNIISIKCDAIDWYIKIDHRPCKSSRSRIYMCMIICTANISETHERFISPFVNGDKTLSFLIHSLQLQIYTRCSAIKL